MIGCSTKWNKMHVFIEFLFQSNQIIHIQIYPTLFCQYTIIFKSVCNIVCKIGNRLHVCVAQKWREKHKNCGTKTNQNKSIYQNCSLYLRNKYILYKMSDRPTFKYLYYLACFCFLFHFSQAINIVW